MDTLTTAEANQRFGQWLKIKRDAAGLTVSGFARHLESIGCDGILGSYRFYESGKQMPLSPMAPRLIEALEDDPKVRLEMLAARLRITAEALESLLGLTSE